MKTIFVRYYHPHDVFGDLNGVTEQDIKKHCFKVNKYATYSDALAAYSNTGGVAWSTMLDEDEDVEKWIDEAYEHIKSMDGEWLEMNFT